MHIIRLWNYLRGYVIIKVEGLTLERFLNLAATNNIYLWDIKRLDYTLLEIRVGIEGFKALKEIVKKVGCKVEIVDKNGLPFLLQRLRERKMLGFGFFVFLAIIIFLYSLIWDIKILGNERIKSQAILQLLEEENIKPGIIKYSLNKDDIKDFLLDEFDQLSFVSVENKGTRLIIEVKEQDLAPESIDTNMPCNIIAARKGVILKTIAKNGSSLVRKGDVVEKGDILITGIISDEDPEVEDILVHAEGEVMARTVYTHSMEEPIVRLAQEETGNIYETHELRVGNRGIQISKDNIPFKDYIESAREIKPFGKDINLPIKIIVHEYKEVESKEVEQDIDLLKKSIHLKAIEGINKQLPEKIEIASKDVKYTIDDKILSIHIVVEAIEDIGEKHIIKVN